MKTVEQAADRVVDRQQEPGPKRRILSTLVVFALAAATIAIGVTGALFTDTQTNTNSIATGDVTLSVTESNPLPWTITAMAPGDTDGPVTVPVSNSGSLELRYAITSTETTTTSPDLAGQLDLSIWDESAESTADGTCDATPTSGQTLLYTTSPLGSAGATINLIGDPTAGQNTGDRVLPAGNSEVLCFYLELPSSTDNTFESLTTSVDLDFEAEQTANNA